MPAVRLARSFRLLRLVAAIQGARRRAAKTFAGIEARTAGKEERHGEIGAEFPAWGRAFAAFSQQYMLLAAPAHTRLATALDRYFPGRGQAMANALMAGAADITSAEHGRRLMEMAVAARGDAAARRFLTQEPFSPLDWEAELPDDSPFKEALRAFLADFGRRGVYEMEVANPRWREDPSQMRESAKSSLARLVDHVRRLSLDVGRRLVDSGILGERDDVFHCAVDEIMSILAGGWDGRGLAPLVAERKVRRREMEAAEPPDLIVGGVPRFAAPWLPAGAAVLSGIGVAAGRASGPVKILASPLAGEKLVPGDVLVAPSTDPAWTLLFLRAAAIVMETGGLGSHGAIVAREYGIPAVVNVPGVLKVLSDGQTVTVDGDAGKVYGQLVKG